MNITNNEAIVLKEIVINEFRDGGELTDTIWVDCLNDSCQAHYGMNARSLSGIFSSLNKKGLAWSDGECCAITDAGLQALTDAGVHY